MERLNFRWKLVTRLTIWATNLSNIILRDRNWSFQLNDFMKMPINSLGRNLYDYLIKTDLSYKPNLIRHDMKHILLNYEMKMPDELKIHAFLIGNKTYNFMGIIYLIISTCIVPEIIPTLIQAYKRGKKAVRLKNIDIQDYVTKDIEWTRQVLNII